MCEEAKKRLVVSLTSYPARIGYVATAVESILNQTHQPDMVVLWLAQEQFPEAEKSLPADLHSMITQGKLTLRWCDDLKSHKKYFYALQEFSEDLVVTVDDDLIYPENMLENLYQSYLRHPDAVSTVRAHLIIISEQGGVMPYRDWIQETDVCLDEPSMQLFATGGAGTLYPGGIFPPELLDKTVIMDRCPMADDLWLKAMELICNVAVVVAQEYEDLHYIPGSQKEALYRKNVDAFQNDVQWEKINDWVNMRYGENFLSCKLTQSDIGTRILGIEAICLHLRRERQKKKEQNRQLNEKLKVAYAEKSEINAKLKQAYADKSEINAKLKQAYADKSEINAKLKQAYADKSEINAKLKQANEKQSEKDMKIQELEIRIAQLTEALEEEKQKHPVWNAIKRSFRK